ncbi:MAG: putative capsid protein [Circoviridae sp.]|nr:MAG: putative capsid protein [Circoviridae sp.]
MVSGRSLALRRRSLPPMSLFNRRTTRGTTGLVGEILRSVVERAVSQSMAGVRSAVGNAIQRGRSRTRRGGGSKSRTPRGRSRRAPGVGIVKYQTRGSVGKFRNRRKPQRVSLFAKKGSVKMVEIGGTISSRVGPDPADEKRVVYIGHTTFEQFEMWLSFCRAIVRRLVNESGLYFNNWEDQATWQAVHVIRIDYRKGVDNPVFDFVQTGGSLQQGSYGIFVGDTWNQIAVKVAKTFAKIQENTEYNVIVHRINLIDTTSTDQRVVAIDMAQSKWTVECMSKLCIQNRTIASVTDGNSDVVTDVANNPVYGRRYMVNGNGLRPRATPQNAPATITPLLVGGFEQMQSTPIIKVTPFEAEYRKPPPSTFFLNTKATSKAMIKPGEIKSSYLKFKKTYSVNTFLKEFKLHLQDLNLWFDDETINFPQKHFTNIGNTEVIAVEKVLDSRVDEPTISLGYECNYSIKSYLTAIRNVATVPLIDVRATALSTEI